jgi:hypothetical protein
LKVCKQVVIVEYSDSLNCLIIYNNSKEDSKNRIASNSKNSIASNRAGTLATTGILHKGDDSNNGDASKIGTGDMLKLPATANGQHQQQRH